MARRNGRGQEWRQRRLLFKSTLSPSGPGVAEGTVAEGTVFASHGLAEGCAKSGSEPTRLSPQLAVRNGGSRDIPDSFEGIGYPLISSEFRGATAALPFKRTAVPLAFRPVLHLESRSRLVVRLPPKHPETRKHFGAPFAGRRGALCRRVQDSADPAQLNRHFSTNGQFSSFCPFAQRTRPL
jgi:hypothetical protein